MKVVVQDKARDFILKKGQDSAYVFLKGCSS